MWFGMKKIKYLAHKLNIQKIYIDLEQEKTCFFLQTPCSGSIRLIYMWELELSRWTCLQVLHTVSFRSVLHSIHSDRWTTYGILNSKASRAPGPWWIAILMSYKFSTRGLEEMEERRTIRYKLAYDLLTCAIRRSYWKKRSRCVPAVPSDHKTSAPANTQHLRCTKLDH